MTIEDPQVVDNTAPPPRSASAMSNRTITSSPAESTSSNLALPKTDLTEKVDMLPDDMVEKRKKEKHIGSQVCFLKMLPIILKRSHFHEDHLKVKQTEYLLIFL